MIQDTELFAADLATADITNMAKSATDVEDLNELLGSMDANDDEFIADDLPEIPISTEEHIEQTDVASSLSETPKPKRVRSKKTKTEESAGGVDIISNNDSVVAEDESHYKAVETVNASTIEKEDDPEQSPGNTEELDVTKLPQANRRTTGKRSATPSVLTIESHTEIETQENLEEAAWHEIRNAYRTRKILTGVLGGIEQTEAGKTIAIVHYGDFRVVIPMKEMMINLNKLSGQEYDNMMLRQNKILGNMLGSEIDFIVKGIESKSRSIVASRKEAMFKKRQLFYLNTDASGMYRIYEGRVVQARIIAVAEKVVRIEAFGVECSILARDLSWDWIGDAHERFSVGDQVLVRILRVTRNSLEDISIKADIKSVSDNTSHEALKKCRVQSKYAGTVTDVHKGVVYVRLTNGVNAVAHSCYDRRTPGKKDDVSFAITKIDQEQGVAVGIITRIIKQHL